MQDWRSEMAELFFHVCSGGSPQPLIDFTENVLRKEKICKICKVSIHDICDNCKQRQS